MNTSTKRYNITKRIELITEVCNYRGLCDSAWFVLFIGLRKTVEKSVEFKFDFRIYCVRLLLVLNVYKYDRKMYLKSKKETKNE